MIKIKRNKMIKALINHLIQGIVRKHNLTLTLTMFTLNGSQVKAQNTAESKGVATEVVYVVQSYTQTDTVSPHTKWAW